jgi:membrane fusion protein (multidrug efflux system)
MTEPEAPPRRGGGKIVLAVIFLLCMAAGAAFYWHQYMRGMVSTDDARFDGKLLDLAPQISGTITEIFVNEGDRVRKGQLLFSLDKKSLEAALIKSKATVDSALASLVVSREQHEKCVRGPRRGEIRIAKAAEQRSKTHVRLTASDWNRVKGLNDAHVMTPSERDKVRTAWEAAKKAHEEAKSRLDLLLEGTRKEDINVAKANVQLKESQLAAAKAAELLAQVNFERTEVHAPFDGIVVRRWQSPGAIVSAGRPVLTIFDPSSLYVAANIEEKYLNKISIGDIVDISIDAYPNLTITGRVDKILRATNSNFSLIPSEGASGTYIKVAQRVPIKIVVDSYPDLPLGPGLSVEIKIHISKENLGSSAVASQKFPIMKR